MKYNEYSDFFFGIGRFGSFDTVVETNRLALDSLATLCATRFKGDYVLIATEMTDNIRIFGAHGHDYRVASHSDGIRGRLGRSEQYIFLTKIADEPKFRHHQLFATLGCLQGSLISFAGPVRAGIGRTGVTVLTNQPIPKPSPDDIEFLKSLASVATAYVDAFLSAELMEGQKRATWSNIDSLSGALSATPIGVAVFDRGGRLCYANKGWKRIEQEISYSIPATGMVAEPMLPFGHAIANTPSTSNNDRALVNYSALEERIELKLLISKCFSSPDTVNPLKYEFEYYDSMGNLCKKLFSIAPYPILDSNGSQVYTGIILYDGMENVRDNYDYSEGSCSADGTFIANFLDSTLRATRRSFWRSNIEYTIARAWKASLKTAQVSAVKIAKTAPSAPVVDLAAQDIYALSLQKYGNSIASVVPVPCGNSPHNRCFSRLVAQAVARLLEVPVVEAFPHSGLAGASGPHKARYVRAPDRLEAIPPSPALLIDDVVNTGTHIAQYSGSLKKNGIDVYAVAWIGPFDQASPKLSGHPH